MSKQIAQNVGGRELVWLIAIVAALAIVATLGPLWNKAEAMEPDLVPASDSVHYIAADAQQLNQPDNALVDGQDSVGAITASSDNLIPIEQIGRLVRATILSIHADSTDTPSGVSVAIRGSGYIRQATLLEVLVARTGLSPCHGDACATTHYLSAISSLDPPTACSLWLSCETGNSKSIPTRPLSVNRGLVPTGGVLSSQASDSQISGTGPASERNGPASDSGNAATWLYAVLGLGALAFGVGGATVARRSR